MAKKKSAVEEVKKEVKVKVEPQPEIPDHDGLIDRIYLVKKTGPEMFEGLDAEAHIKAIQKANAEDDTAYTFYEDGRPVYIAIKNGYYSPLVFPEPGPDTAKQQSGMTSMELYGLTVTFASTIEKIIELETQPKPSLIDQAKKIMTPTLVIVASILAIFLLAVMTKG